VEFDLVNPVAETVVGAKDRGIAIRDRAESEGLAAHDCPELQEPVKTPPTTFPRHRFSEHAVLREQVVVLEGRGLVQDLGRSRRLRHSHRASVQEGASPLL